MPRLMPCRYNYLPPMPRASSFRVGAITLCAAAWFVTAAIGNSAAAAAPPPAAQTAVPDQALSQATPDDIVGGKRVFNSQCALCHGIDGVGGAGPSLQQPTLRRVADDAGLVRLIKTGVPGAMPGDDFGANAEHRVWQVAAYVRSLGRAESERATGDPDHGAAIYRQRGCASCHVIGGDGRSLGPDLSAIGSQRGLSYLRESIVEPAAKVPDGHVVVTARPRSGPTVRGVRVNEVVFWVHIRDISGVLHAFQKSGLQDLQREPGASLMPAYSRVLTPSEIDDEVAYLASLRGTR